MRHPVHKLIGTAVVAALAVLVAAPALAGAQSTTTVAPSCVFTVSGNPVPNPPGFPANVTVSGTASPVGATITAYLDGVAANTTTVKSDDTFSMVVHVTGEANLTVGLSFGLNGYTGTCATPSGELVVRIRAAEAAKAALAFTGSSNTVSYLLVGLAAVVLGFVFVIAARRRSQINNA